MARLIDLVSLEFAFSQRRLLDVDEFRRACERRGLSLFWNTSAQLEKLHRVGILFPLYRVRRGMQSSFAKIGTSSSSLKAYHAAGQLYDPRDESFRPWSPYKRKENDQSVETSKFIYSPYQLLLIPVMREFLPKMKMSHTKDDRFHFTLKLKEQEKAKIERERTSNDKLVTILTMLDRIYYPRIVRKIHLSSESFEDWEHFETTFDPVEALSWIGVSADSIQETAIRLLSIADEIDPLSDWLELVQLCRPEKWENLRGDALIAIDYRIAAEILLRFYEDLVEQGVATPLPEIPPLAAHPLTQRLRPNYDNLDTILMDFGISPHPSLVLFTEGETEMIIVPRVIELLGVTQRRSFIEVHTYRGTSAQIDKIISYIAPLSLGELRADYIEFTRPPTRFLVVADPENEFADPVKVEEKRQGWIEGVFKALPHEYQTDVVRSQLNWFIQVETWGNESFEFAHFENNEIIQGIQIACEQRGIKPKSISVNQVEEIRRLKKSIDKLWGGTWGPRLPLSKTILAEAMWPILEQKIQQAILQQTLDNIPLVRVLRRAVDLALEVERYDVVIRRL